MRNTISVAVTAAMALCGSTAHAAWLTALGADGGSVHVVNPDDPSSLVSFLGQHYTGASDGSLFSGVVAHDVDATNPGDELIFSRQLDDATGTRGLFVHRATPEGDRSVRIGFNSQPHSYASMVCGQFLDSGTRTGVAVFRYGVHSNSPFLEIWDPEDILTGGSRTSLQHGNQDANWLRTSIGAGELSASGTGDEFIVIRTDPTTGAPTNRFEVWGLTGSDGTDDAYTRLSTQTVLSGTAAAVTIATGAGPSGDGVAVVLRSDGRLTFWDMIESDGGSNDGIDDSTRLAYTSANSAWGNFLQVADVLDSNAGDELIVGINEAGGGVQGLAVYAMPDLTVQVGDLGVLSPLYTLDVDQELIGVDVFSTIPEPASLALVAIGGLMLVQRRRGC